MANLNKVILAGNLTRDPQMSALPSGTPVAEFGLAINRRWKGQDGQMKDETCFVDCRGFGRTAELVNQYFRKGRPILVEGRLRYEAWESKEGQKRSKLSVVVDQFHFIDSKREGGEGGSQESYSRSAPQTTRPQVSREEAPPPPQEYDAGEPGGEHVPF